MSLFSFGICTDIQYADKETEITQDSIKQYKCLHRVKEAVSYFLKEQDKLSFLTHLGIFFIFFFLKSIDKSILSLGDIIDGNENEDKTIEDLDAVLNELSPLSKLPIYHVIGNHCLRVPRELLEKRLELKNPYYSFTIKSWKFLVLDSTDACLKWPQDTENYKFAIQWLEENKGKEGAQTWNGAIMKKQLNWIESELTQAEQNGDKVIIFSHMPLLEKSASPKHLIFNNNEVLSIFDRFNCVKVYFSGHYHKGGYEKRNLIHYVTLEAILEAENNAYGIVDVHENKVIINGFGQLTSRILEF